MNTVQLIESIKKQSNIYKNLHDDDEEYLKEWQKVAEECQITSDEAQNQWNMLLLEYMEYLRGNHDFTMSKYMDFIQPHLFTIIEDDVLDEDELLNILNEGKIQLDIDGTSAKKCNKEYSVSSHYTDEVTSLRMSQVSQENIHIKQERMPLITQPTPPVIQLPQAPLAQQTVQMNAQNESSISNLTSIELIFLGYAKQLQKMPLPLQLQTKRKIADLMDEAELKMMDQM